MTTTFCLGGGAIRAALAAIVLFLRLNRFAHIDNAKTRVTGALQQIDDMQSAVAKGLNISDGTGVINY